MFTEKLAEDRAQCHTAIQGLSWQKIKDIQKHRNQAQLHQEFASKLAKGRRMHGADQSQQDGKARAHQGGEHGLSLTVKAHARQGHGPQKRQEDHAAPGLTHHAIGKQMTQFVHKQRRDQKPRNRPAHQHGKSSK